MGTGIIEWRCVYYGRALAQLEREGALPAAEAAKSPRGSPGSSAPRASAYAARERRRSNNHWLWLDVTTLAPPTTSPTPPRCVAATSIVAARLDEQLDARGLLAQEIARGDHYHHYVLFTYRVARRREVLARLEPAEAPDGGAAAVDAARRRICEMAARHVDAADGQCPGVAIPSEVARRDHAGREVGRVRREDRRRARRGARRGAAPSSNTSIAPFWQLASMV